MIEAVFELINKKDTHVIFYQFIQFFLLRKMISIVKSNIPNDPKRLDNHLTRDSKLNESPSFIRLFTSTKTLIFKQRICHEYLLCSQLLFFIQIQIHSLVSSSEPSRFHQQDRNFVCLVFIWFDLLSYFDRLVHFHMSDHRNMSLIYMLFDLSAIS